MKQKNNVVTRLWLLLVCFTIGTMNSWGQTAYLMSGGDYSETFTNISNATNWPNGFNGTDCAEWGVVGIITAGAIPDPKTTTKSSATFVSGTTGGLQKGSAALRFLSTGSTANANAVAADLLLNFTGRNAGTLSFDWLAVDNGSGTRPSSLRVYWSTDGSSFTELTTAQVLEKTSPNIGAITNIALPSQFNNSSSAVLRFYNHTGTASGSGNRDYIDIDNITVTSTAMAPPDVTISNNGTQVQAANVNAGATNVVLHQSALAVTTADATLTQMSCTSNGTFQSGDVDNLKIWYSTDNTFDAGTDVALSAVYGLTGAGVHTFSTFTSQLISNGSTGYIFITADISSTATHGNTVVINALTTSDYTFTNANKTGSTTAGGAQTIQNTTSSASDIVAGSFAYTTDINYIDYTTPTGLTTANAIKIGEFIVRDGGGSADADNASTKLTDITFSVEGSENIAALAIFEGTSNVAENTAVTGGTSFSGLSIEAADGGTATFSVYASFKTTVSDGGQLMLIVSSATADVSGSKFAQTNAGGASTLIASGENTIDVIATKLVFTTQPSATANYGVALSTQPVVAAQDNNNNIDGDYTETVTLTVIGNATISAGNASEAATSGVVTYSNIALAGSGLNILKASDGNLFVNSQSIDVSFGPIFTETMGTVGGTTLIDAHETANGFDNDNFTMSGTGDVRITSASSLYTGASGLGNVLINALDEYFQIAGINTSLYSDISLSFGFLQATASNTAADFKVEVSADGTNWTALNMTFVTNANWNLQTPTGKIPTTSNLRIKFTNTQVGTNNFRVDDVKLTGTPLTTWNGSSWNNGNPASYTNVAIDGLYSGVGFSANDVTITPSGELSVDNGETLTVNGDLLLESDASGTGSLVNAGTVNITGTSTVQQYLASGNRYYYISSPVSDATATIFGVTDPNKLYQTDGATWTRVTDANTTLTPLKGYAYKTDASKTINFAGTLNDGNQNMGISGATTYTLVGNPYPSSIDWGLDADVPASWSGSVGNTIWYRVGGDGSTGGNFATYNRNGGGATGGGQRYIPAMQAFWVQNTSSGMLTVGNDARVHSNQAFYKNAQKPTSKGMHLVINGGDDALVAFNTDATDDYNSAKMLSDGLPQIYTLLNNKQMAISTFKSIETNLSLPVGVRVVSAGLQNIAMKDFNNFDASVSVYLEDKTTGVMHNLRASAYNFDATEGIVDNRFVLHFTNSTTGITNVGKNAVNVYAYDKTAYISTQTDGTAQVFDVTGRLVATKTLSGANTMTCLHIAKTGVYVVKVSTANGITTHKIVIE